VENKTEKDKLNKKENHGFNVRLVALVIAPFLAIALGIIIYLQFVPNIFGMDIEGLDTVLPEPGVGMELPSGTVWTEDIPTGSTGDPQFWDEINGEIVPQSPYDEQISAEADIYDAAQAIGWGMGGDPYEEGGKLTNYYDNIIKGMSPEEAAKDAGLGNYDPTTDSFIPESVDGLTTNPEGIINLESALKANGESFKDRIMQAEPLENLLNEKNAKIQNEKYIVDKDGKVIGKVEPQKDSNGNTTSYKLGQLGISPEALKSALENAGGGAGGAEANPTLAELIKKQEVKDAWQFILNLINYFIIFALIIIAFANILHIQIDTYAIKKILPTLIVAILLANFSFIICEMFLTLGSAVYFEILKIGGAAGTNPADLLIEVYKKMYPGLFGTEVISLLKGGLTAIAIGGVGAGLGMIPGFLVGLFLLTIPAIMFMIIWFLLLLRKFVIILLVVLSPLAFFAVGLPMTSQYFKIWWSNFMKWVFMPAASFLVIAIALKIHTAVYTKGSGGIVSFGILLGSLILAIIIPFKLGGSLNAAWGGLGKGVAKLAGRAIVGAGKFASPKGTPLDQVKAAWGIRMGEREKQIQKAAITGALQNISGRSPAARWARSDESGSVSTMDAGKLIHSADEFKKKLGLENNQGAWGKVLQFLDSNPVPEKWDENLKKWINEIGIPAGEKDLRQQAANAMKKKGADISGRTQADLWRIRQIATSTARTDSPYAQNYLDAAGIDYPRRPQRGGHAPMGGAAATSAATEFLTEEMAEISIATGNLIKPELSANEKDNIRKHAKNIRQELDKDFDSLASGMSNLGISPENIRTAFNRSSGNIANFKQLLAEELKKTGKINNIKPFAKSFDEIGENLQKNFQKSARLEEVEIEVPVSRAYKVLKGKGVDMSNIDNIKNAIGQDTSELQKAIQNKLGSDDERNNVIEVVRKFSADFEPELKIGNLSERASKAQKIASEINQGNQYMMKKITDGIKDPVANFERVAGIMKMK